MATSVSLQNAEMVKLGRHIALKPQRAESLYEFESRSRYKEKEMEREVYIDKIVIDDNTAELHKQLRSIGYSSLDWTTSNREGARTILTNHYYPKMGHSNYVFWSDGEDMKSLERYERNDDLIICKSIDEFIDYAKTLHNQEYIIITKS